MLRPTVRLAPLLLLATATSAVAAPRGRVVRVDRSRGQSVPPRLCVLMDTPGKLLCVGEARAGDAVSFLDSGTGELLGEARIDSAGSGSRMAACAGKAPVLFDVSATLVSGSADLLGRSRTVALRGLSLPRHAHGVPEYKVPEERQAETLQIAIDTDGDSRVDTALYNYACDEQGRVASGGTSDRQCFDTYQERGGRLVRTHQDLLELCH